ncbi:hypothetical protein A2875_01290 [Candidatus Gottesmanbacteria bacterium RIFCSPHIGHO2_01_FULL_46_14]|uniref:UDP-N-acetylglucosamine--N-acetylmuramyl-(pentapeptide) pyrophosphoryl-undecaprenol N-acetylglucosamine transferase n=2 Tax=Candidatus Gottesmaniibacteriota TaxID=1752720 RepID=A0A1F5ZR97_9BACT|nr:MAG: hypothetical protein A2875_01290 [Candidatus Gottesmanbacteria bacterium RIFCSPHIGHO2_01_FULL_46_14]OGG29258.1 MAG: hypothetical protein A2971_01580 [Candidatus Gottesmanbacteria bacterium RIFCSPLOWO2_01_FULL_46_21]
MAKRKKILMTGGHITPAIAVADALKKTNTQIDIVFAGRDTSIEGSNSQSEEARLVNQRGFRFVSIQAGRITRAFTLLTAVGIFRIPFGFIAAFGICLSERPDVIVSFGGYVALPVVIAGWMLAIPSITHEQTLSPGLANRIIGLFAKKICVSFPQTVKDFPSDKTVLTGLPLRESIFHPPKNSPFPLGNKPLIIVTGGSTGAVTLNRLVFPIVENLTTYYSIIHQTGRLDLQNAPDVPNYFATAYLDEPAYAWAIGHADLVVGRSGANTVGEVAVLGKVALFVPLPWSGGNEQYENARYLETVGTSQVLNQKNLTPGKLLGAIEGIFRDKQTYDKKAVEISREFPRDGAVRVADQVMAILSHA